MKNEKTVNDKLDVLLLKGVSIVELLLVISIIAILTISVLPTISSFNKDQNLSQATENISSEIKTIRDKAVSGAVDSPDTTAKRVWWGFNCAGTNYQLGQADNNSSMLPASFVSVQSKEVSSQTGITISCSTNPFYFKRLTGELYSSTGIVNDFITISVSGTSTKTIKVYRTGKIVVE